VLVDTAAGGVPVEVGYARVMVGGGALAGALIGKLERRLAEARAEQRKAAGKLANAAFVDRAPAAVVVEERERAERFGREADGLESKLAELRGA
jgi:valyl-tRNA synthetase